MKSTPHYGGDGNGANSLADPLLVAVDKSDLTDLESDSKFMLPFFLLEANVEIMSGCSLAGGIVDRIVSSDFTILTGSVFLEFTECDEEEDDEVSSFSRVPRAL